MNTQKFDKWQRMAAITHPSFLSPPVSIRSLFYRRFFYENVFVFLFQLSGLWLTTLKTPTPIWFASGAACAFVFLRGFSVLVGIGLGTFAAYWFAGLSASAACFVAGILTLQATLIRWISLKWITQSLVFYKKMVFIQFVLATAFITALTTACIVKQSFWWQAWLANFNGVVIFAIAIMTLDTYFPEITRLKTVNRGKLIFYFSLLVFFTLLFVCYPHWMTMTGLFLMMIMISHSFRFAGSVAGLFIVGFLMGIYSTAEFAGYLTLLAVASIWISTGLEVQDNDCPSVQSRHPRML